MAFVDPGEGGLLPPDNFENPGEILQGKGFSRPPAIGAPKGFTAPPRGIVGPGFNAPGPIAQSPGFQMPAPGPMTNSDPIMDEWAAALRGSIQRITGKNVMTSKATPREEVNKAFEGMKQGQQSLSLEEIRRQVELENSLGEPVGMDMRYGPRPIGLGGMGNPSYEDTGEYKATKEIYRQADAPGFKDEELGPTEGRQYDQVSRQEEYQRLQSILNEIHAVTKELKYGQGDDQKPWNTYYDLWEQFRAAKEDYRKKYGTTDGI